MSVGNLKERDLATLGDGIHGDGDYLWLRVKGNARSWVVRGPRINGKKPEAGLGSLNRVSLALARKERDKLVEQWRAGVNPIAERQAAKEAAANRKTFAEVAELKLTAQRSGWRTSAHGRCASLEAWTLTIKRDCAPIAKKAINEITFDDVERIVSSIWDVHPKTARDTVKRIEMIFNFAIARKWCVANPASWSLFKEVWPKAKKAKASHAALPWRDAPYFMHRLRASNAIGARALEFAILTAVRSGEALGARWDEIDLKARTWTIPTERMKADREHVVPLSTQAVALLERIERIGDYVFSARMGGCRLPVSDARVGHNSAYRIVKQLAPEITMHGFRSSFRDWAAERLVDFHIAEQCLAHAIGNAASQAYLRTTLVEQRRPIMQAWADFLSGQKDGKVLPFRKAS